MKNLFIKLSQLLLFLSFYSINGQSYLFDAQLLKTENGLANLMTTSVIEDQNGYLWIGTAYGLNRYDGYHFTLYTKEKNGLYANNGIHEIKEDDQGNLWLFYYHHFNNNFSELNQIAAIDIFNPKTEQIVSFASFFGTKAPFDIKDLLQLTSIDTRNNLWFATKDGTVHLFKAGEFTKIYEQPETLFEYITVDEKEDIWLGWNKQLTKINLEGTLLEKHDLPEPLRGIWTGEHGRLWLATGIWSDFSKQNKASDEFKYNLWSKAPDDKISPLFLQKDNRKVEMTIRSGVFMHRTRDGFWYLKKDNQLQVFDANGGFLHNFNSSLEEQSIFDFSNYFESADHLWIVSPTGLLKTTITENPFRLIHQKEGFSDCRGITEDEAGNIYFLNQWAYQWHPAQEKLPKKLPVLGYFALTYLDSFLWMSSYHNKNLGVEINLHTNEIVNYDKLNGCFAFTTLKTKTTGKLLMGTEEGLIYLNIKDKSLSPFTQYNEFDSLKNSEIYHLHRNENGIWAATNQGVFLIEKEKGVTRMYNSASKDLPFDYIRHIHETEDGVFWLATKGGGVIRWQPSLIKGQVSTHKQFTTQEGLSHNFTYAIYGDNNGKLWIPSDIGLMCMDKTSYEVSVFLKENGLPHNEFNSTAHYQAKDGTLYFGGLGGLISFHPKAMGDRLINNTPLQFVRYQVLEEGKEKNTDKTALLASTNTISIQPTDKFFELAFALLDYDDPRRHKYAYQLEGYSNQWNYIEENYVRIPSLPYGDYSLKIKGRNYGKDWSSQILSLNIKVLKPFYLETWFLLTTFIGLICLLISLVNWRLQRLQKDRERLEAEVQKRTETIREQAQALKALDKSKTRFFSNITHEFRTPLTLVIGPLEQVMEMDLSIKSRTKLTSVLDNARHLLGLINQLLDLSKLESGQMKVEIVYGDIIAYTKDLAKRIQPLADKKQQSFHLITQKTIWKTQFDKKKWDKIIYNLLSNAIKYTPEAGTIQVELFETEFENAPCIYLKVKDSGIGIKKHQLSQIFNRFYQVDDSSTRDQEGTGIGLALVKELIELQGGIIMVTSELEKGTTFEVKIPIVEQINKGTNPNLLASDTILPTNPIIAPIAKEVKNETKEQLKILIIEDNAALRSYIQDCLDSTKYHITEAANGIEGIEAAMTIIPDLIISDVMMPGKNGFEVTATIRKNKATSHIPIILLTAKAALESRLKGIEKGADVYLTKPFSPKELSIRVAKLIELRELIQQSIQQPELNHINPIYKKENLFVQEVRWIIINNINSVDLNGEFIGQQLGMSRMQVHRKMKALVNQSASEMIKEIRLKKAYELLLSGNHNISEVAYQTGFNTLAYFSKIFKEKFGYAPSECIKKISI